MQRSLVLAGLAVASALALTACSASSTGDTDPSEAAGKSKGAVAVGFPGLSIQIWNDTLDILRPRLAADGYELLTSDPEFDVQKQIADWDAWASRGDVKAMAGFPVQVDALVPVTARLVESGVPVVGYSTKWQGVDYALVTNATEDGELLGSNAAEWITETYGAEPVSVAVLSDREADLGRERTDGIIAALAEGAPNAKVTELPGLTREDGVANAERQLIADPETKVWLSTSGDNILGAYQTLLDQGVDPDDPKYAVGSLDATDETFGILADPDTIFRLSYGFTAQSIADALYTLLTNAASKAAQEDVVLEPTKFDSESIAELGLTSK